MKKSIIIAVVIVAALAFCTISCKKDSKSEPTQPTEDVAKCWKFTVKTTTTEVTYTEIGYFWGTEAEIEDLLAATNAAMKELEVTAEITKEEASQYTTQADCKAQNTEED